MKSTKRNLQWFQKFNKRWIIFFTLLILPFCVIYISGLSEWIGRTIAYCLFFSFIPLSTWWWSLNPRTVIVGDAGKLAQPGNEKSRRKFEIVARVAVFLFGVFSFLHFTLPLGQDVYALLSGKSPIEITGIVVDNDTPYGAWCLSQSIRLQNEPSAKSHGLMFSLEPRINRGKFVRLLILPHSRMIVKILSD